MAEGFGSRLFGDIAGRVGFASKSGHGHGGNVVQQGVSDWSEGILGKEGMRVGVDVMSLFRKLSCLDARFLTCMVAMVTDNSNRFFFLANQVTVVYSIMMQ